MDVDWDSTAIRAEIVATLGGRCVRCGLDDGRVLEVHHLDNDGHADRRQGITGRTVRFMKMVRSHPEKYCLLCANCHRLVSFWDNGDRPFFRRFTEEELASMHSHSTTKAKAASKRRYDALTPEERTAWARMGYQAAIGNHPEEQRRRIMKRWADHVYSVPSHCGNGHLLDETNRRDRIRNGRQTWDCRACERSRHR
jgi:hypothetical protein